MAGIQVGGIVSGMDTNGIVEKLLVQAKVPVDRLYGDYEYKKNLRMKFIQTITTSSVHCRLICLICVLNLLLKPNLLLLQTLLS